jgi:hypothetical protein
LEEKGRSRGVVGNDLARSQNGSVLDFSRALFRPRAVRRTAPRGKKATVGSTAIGARASTSAHRPVTTPLAPPIVTMSSPSTAALAASARTIPLGCASPLSRLPPPLRAATISRGGGCSRDVTTNRLRHHRLTLLPPPPRRLSARLFPRRPFLAGARAATRARRARSRSSARRGPPPPTPPPPPPPRAPPGRRW